MVRKWKWYLLTVYRWAGSVECLLSNGPGTPSSLLGNGRLGIPALDSSEPLPRQFCGRASRVKLLPVPAFCRCALRGELLLLLVLPQLGTVMTAMASTNCVVFSWHHQGRVEGLFLELSASHNIHFLRVTRGGRVAWGACFPTPNGPRLCLRSFGCCLGARLRDLTFDVDPSDSRRMIDGTGRFLYYIGVLRSKTLYPTRTAAFKLSRQRMMNGLCSRGEFLSLGIVGS